MTTTDAYDYEQHSAEDLNVIANKLRSNLKSKDAMVKQLKLAARVLEHLPQEVSVLGSARQVLEEVFVDRHVLGSKHKDVRMYLAVCLAHMLRIYAPDTPWEDSRLEPMFDLLLWSIQQVGEFQAPMFELAVSVLQTISQTKSYFLLLDVQREDGVLDWVRALLQCINAGSSPLAGPHAMEVLSGLVSSDEGHSDDVLEVLLSYLVAPKSVEAPAACQLSQAVLKACESGIKPQLQKYLTKLIQCPISSNSDLHRQCYALIYQLYQAVPQVLLPVLPHLTSELQAEEGAKRLEAVCLLGKLFSFPGSRLVCEFNDMLDALLERYQDTQVDVRVKALEFTPSLVAAAISQEQQNKVLQTAALRLQDYDEKVRITAVKIVCQTVRQLLVGPAVTAAGTACPQHMLALSSPTADLLGGLGSQEDDAAAAEELGVAYSLPDAGLSSMQVQAVVHDLACVQDVMQRVSFRLKDTKASVRRAAASGMLAVFRAVVAAGNSEQVALCSSLPARVILCAKSDPELRLHVVEGPMKDGLLAPQVPAAQAAAVWIRMWLTAQQREREAIMAIFNWRTRLQAQTAQLVALRRKLSCKDGKGSDPELVKAELDKAVREVAKQLPDAHKAAEGLVALQGVRDNHVFASMQQALSPTVEPEAFAKFRADALSRVGSKSAAAELISQLLLWARASSWLPQPLLACVLELAAGDPDGEQAEMVLGAFQFLQQLSKNAPTLFASLLPELHQLMCSKEQELQQLGVQLLGQCAIQLRKRGIVLTSSPDTKTAAHVQQQVLPCLRLFSKGKSPAGSSHGGNTRAEDMQDGGVADDAELDSQLTAALGSLCTPKSAKWAVYGLVCCQDGVTGKRELEQLADELSNGLVSTAPETAARFQALATIGRVYPGDVGVQQEVVTSSADAFGRHVEQLLRFVFDDYLLSYLDAAAAGAASAPGGSSRSPTAPRSAGGGQQLASPAVDSQAEATAVWLKAAALKALAAGCVPDSDSGEVPVETLRAVAQIAQELEGLLDPSEEGQPAFLEGAPTDLCGHLRLSAAAALLRLARRHDSRLAPSCYCMLALVMQDNLEAVRQGFAVKVVRLMNYYQSRPSTHQLAAKYAAMLPLAAMDPADANKIAAARYLRDWVHRRRAHVQQLITVAAAAAAAGGRSRDAQEGGSTMQDLPEMVLPYGLYILAHHPDFPQDDDAGEAAFYEPFQFMLQFLLAPLLVASGGTPAGSTIPALLKTCRSLKRTIDVAAEPCNTQLYGLCDIAAACITALAQHLQLDVSEAGEYPGVVVLPKGLYRPLDKADRVTCISSYLPDGFTVKLDTDALQVLAQPHAAVGAAAAVVGRSTAHSNRTRSAAAAAVKQPPTRKSGKRKRGTSSSKEAAAGAVPNGGGGQAPGTTSRPGQGGKGRTRRRAAAADSDDGWDSDTGEGSPAEVIKPGQQLTHRQQLLLQRQQQQAADPPGQVTLVPKGKQQGGHLKQQPLTFQIASFQPADASSPAPVMRRKSRDPADLDDDHRQQQQQQHSLLDEPATGPADKTEDGTDDVTTDQHQAQQQAQPVSSKRQAARLAGGTRQRRQRQPSGHRQADPGDIQTVDELPQAPSRTVKAATAHETGAGTSSPVSDASIRHGDQDITLKAAAAGAKAGRAVAPAAADGCEALPPEGATAAGSGGAAMPSKRPAAKKRQPAKAPAAGGRATRRRAG